MGSIGLEYIAYANNQNLVFKAIFKKPAGNSIPLEVSKLKSYLPIVLVSILVFGFVFSYTGGAEENSLAKEAASKISKYSESANQSANQSINKSINQSVNKSVNQSVNKSVNQSVDKSSLKNESHSANVTGSTEGVPLAEQKFRVGPTVVLRPVNDVITENEDGLIELYIDNPSLNDVTLNVDARISVPSGIHVYGQGFGQTGAAGTVYGTFSVPPGTARTIYIDVKGEKVGSSTVHFSGMYWPGDNKDNYNPISLTHPFEIKEPSANPEETPDFEKVTGVNAEAEGSVSAPGFGVLIAAIGLIGVYIARRK